jgi:hypothetical protein
MAEFATFQVFRLIDSLNEMSDVSCVSQIVAMKGNGQPAVGDRASVFAGRWTPDRPADSY